MQHGKRDVHAVNAAAIAAPHSVAADLDRDRHVSGLLEPRVDGGRRGERYLVLGGAASAEHRDARRLHGVGVVVGPVVGVVDEVVVGAVVVVVVVGVVVVVVVVGVFVGAT